MEKNSVSFESESKAFSYVFAALVSLCTLPVLGWHYWSTLEGFAVLAIGGLMMADCVLWFASHWSTKTKSGLMRAASLTVKFGLAAVMVITAAVCILVMRSEHSADHLVEQQTKARAAEIEARAKAAKELAATPGGRAAARELVRMSEAQSAGQVAMTARADLTSKVPDWLTGPGLYLLPPLTALLGALVLSVCGQVAKAREGEAEANTGHSTNVIEFPSSHKDAAIVEPRRKANFDLKGGAADAPAADLKVSLPTMPGKARTDRKPPAVEGYVWHEQNKGFTCRKVSLVDGRRVKKYHGYLNRQAWERMRSENRTGADLKAAVEQWVKSRA